MRTVKWQDRTNYWVLWNSVLKWWNTERVIGQRPLFLFTLIIFWVLYMVSVYYIIYWFELSWSDIHLVDSFCFYWHFGGPSLCWCHSGHSSGWDQVLIYSGLLHRTWDTHTYTHSPQSLTLQEQVLFIWPIFSQGISKNKKAAMGHLYTHTCIYKNVQQSKHSFRNSV